MPDPLREAMARGEQCPRKALMQLGVPLLDLLDRRALDNVNLPHEFEEARTALANHDDHDLLLCDVAR